MVVLSSILKRKKISNSVEHSRVIHCSTKHFMSTVYTCTKLLSQDVEYILGCDQKSLKVIDLRAEWKRAED